MGAEIAGDYSIGAAIAQLMWTVGLFDQSSFLVTDTEGRFTYEQYLSFKIFSCIVMVIGSILYVFSFGYSLEKSILALWLCAFKLVDAFAGYYYSVFQKFNRLDVSGFTMFVQNITAMVVFVPSVVITRDVTLSVAFATVAMAVVTLGLYQLHLKEIEPIGSPDFSLAPLVDQFFQLLPLFLGNFLYSYLANVPKYAIEHVGTNTLQTYFNVLFMPSFAINLCVRFFLRPAVTVLSTYWSEQNISGFVGLIAKLLAGVVGVTAMFMFGAWLVGIPVLNFVFGVDLSEHVAVLVLLLFASGVMVAADVLFYPIVIFRKQIATVVTYGIALAFGYLLADGFVLSGGMIGASLVYFVEALIVLLLFLGITCYMVFKKNVLPTGGEA